MPFSLGFWAAAGAGGGASSDFELISTSVLGSAASSVTFSSVPQTYKHLQIRFVTRGDSFGNSRAYLTLNSDTSSFTYHRLQATSGGGISSSGWGSGTFPGGWVADVNGNDVTGWAGAVVDLLDYTSTNKYKTVRSLNGAASDTSSSRQIQLTSSLWLSTAAVTTVGLVSSVNNFDAGSRFSLYGIKG
jgi:hypothetical protein